MADRFPLIVLGASSGGVDALVRVIRLLPPTLGSALCVAMHVPRTSPSFLPQILSRSGPLPASHVEKHEAIVPNHIYVAPPDHHLIVLESGLSLSHSASENGHRPSIDALFRTAAHAFRERVVGVVLSGALDDGSAGLRDIKRLGGIAIAQDPSDALTPSMPEAAIAKVPLDFVLPAAEIARVLIELSSAPSMAMLRRAQPPAGPPVIDERREGEASGLSCPACGGTLYQRDDGDMMRFRCRVGHAYSEDGLDNAQTQETEDALWSAVRALEERVVLSRRLAERARLRGRAGLAESYERRAQLDGERAQIARRALDPIEHEGRDEEPVTGGR